MPVPPKRTILAPKLAIAKPPRLSSAVGRVRARALHAMPSHSQVPEPLPKSTALLPSGAILLPGKGNPVGGETALGSQDSPFHSHVVSLTAKYATLPKPGPTSIREPGLAGIEF